MTTADPESWLEGADKLDAKASAMEAEALILHNRAEKWRAIAAQLIERSEDSDGRTRRDPTLEKS